MLIKFYDLLFLKEKVKGIIHIGAHELEELKDYLKVNVDRIIWIEANPEKYDLINKKIESFPNMSLGKFAAGRSNDIKYLNIANNSQASSILDFGTHKINYPKINYETKIKVEIKALDDWLENNFANRYLYNFLNIDIQGYELEALKGMKNQLSLIEYIYMEVSFEEVYKGCAELKEIDQFLLKFGFKRVAIKKTKKGWGDALYSKKNILVSRFYYGFILKLKNLPKIIYNISHRLFREFVKKT